ncbi:ferredoxin [Streptomyces griseoloalbus]|uniref:Ferredoxin n=2 Tax=Streptomyces griseoloalbus TaxID=67303 RepID=A0ABV3DXE6_9ACTN|nr:ferredoxin [Streptomyces albaduncus]MBB5128855.1 ferredoxin [Streptomyces albaduncus]GGV78667.1 ferredoxin [Streptomyces griseoloalbus]GGW43363.1 ferredoxin [Streptomyces albaduncus]
MKVHAERDRCIGAGLCTLHAPSVFDQEDDGMVVVLNETPTGTDADDARKVAEHLCPGKAVRISGG